ncbi:glycoprotease [Ephemerocybe angulata]|uniref:N(6)-L-threonylcarbamoyladenine synthase n=1 Tax=Ephemerocybe angulata TaxID=980116 RepID=A0A8H6I731_9AGAR|nr:glycoprotease [Tulosesus angulatus]
MLHASRRATTTLSRLRSSRFFTVLAIESSADDTCAAVVTSDRKILSNVVIKQLSLHEKYGGIEPMTAIQAHQRNLPFAVSRALREAGTDIVKDIDGIAFTRGPGMPGCLSVGMNGAKTMAAALNKPIVGVHHMQGHALTPLLTSDEADLPQFPFLTLLVSGGHTLLLLAESNVKFNILINTVDQAVGRVIDKVSTLLQIPWTPLGPGDALEKYCQDVPETALISLGNSIMRGRRDFSFSGLHSQIELYLKDNGGIEALDDAQRRAIAFSFQYNAFAQLEDKIKLALQSCEMQSIAINHLVVSGGVASNQYLRQRLSACLKEYSPERDIGLVFPPPKYCTDNAVMIAWASMPRFLAGDSDDYGVGLQPKWSIEDLTPP